MGFRRCFLVNFLQNYEHQAGYPPPTRLENGFSV